MRIFFLVVMAIIGLFQLNPLAAQIGGNSTYEFMRIPNSARITGLGGSLITVRDKDINLALHNPASLNPLMHNQISFQQSTYFAGITHGYLGYGHSLQRFDIPVTLHGGIQYISYGKFQQADEVGTITGDFKAGEFAINLGGSFYPTERISIGANLKTIMSYIESYNSVGWAADLGAMYTDTSKNIALSLVFKNMGTQFSTYGRNGLMERLPFDVQFGFAHRLKYLPMRFSVILHNLQRWGILYDDPSAQNDVLFGGGQPKENKAGKFFDNMFRHIIFNIEFLVGKKDHEFLFIRLGYNHYRRGELSVKGIVGLSGFSVGLGIRIKNFQIDYGFSSYHFAGAAHHFGISVNIDEFKK